MKEKTKRNKKLFEDFKKGVSYKQLTQKYGRSRSTLEKIIRRLKKDD